MHTETLIAMSMFFLAATATPGPNNMMLLSSGATFGLARTVPHLLGISLGTALMVFVLGWVLAGVLQHATWLYEALHIVSTLYLLWLAWRIATSSGPRAAHEGGTPLGVIDAAAFQWVNPKAWAMILGAIATFARPGHAMLDLAVIAVVLVVVGLPCITMWAGAGLMLQRMLRAPRLLRAFNIGMAVLLVLSIAPDIVAQVRAVG